MGLVPLKLLAVRFEAEKKGPNTEGCPCSGKASPRRFCGGPGKSGTLTLDRETAANDSRNSEQASAKQQDAAGLRGGGEGQARLKHCRRTKDLGIVQLEAIGAGASKGIVAARKAGAYAERRGLSGSWPALVHDQGVVEVEQEAVIVLERVLAVGQGSRSDELEEVVVNAVANAQRGDTLCKFCSCIG